MSLNTFVWLVILVVFSGSIIAFVRAFLGKPPAEHKPPFWLKALGVFLDQPESGKTAHEREYEEFWHPLTPGGYWDRE